MKNDYRSLVVWLVGFFVFVPLGLVLLYPVADCFPDKSWQASLAIALGAVGINAPFALAAIIVGAGDCLLQVAEEYAQPPL